MDADRFDAATRSLHPRARRRLSLLAPSLALLAGLLVVSPVAFSAVRLGNDTAETLTGTNSADRITGGGGNDVLRGLAGDDTYYFANSWGDDTLEEQATYKVGGKQKPGGRDTLSFRGVTAGGVSANLIPEWGLGSNRIASIDENAQIGTVELGTSVVENIVGTRDSDVLRSGGQANTLSTGGGSADDFMDLGGWRDGPDGQPELPASNDLYRGVAANTDSVGVYDWGGTADVVDLRPLAADEVYMDAVNCDDDPLRECLHVVTGTGTRGQILVFGQFGAVYQLTADFGQQGRIEILRFSDGDVRMDEDVSVSAAAASAETTASLTGEPLTKRQQKLAKRAPALLEAALRQRDRQPELGTQSIDTGERGGHAGAGPGTDLDKDRGTADRGKSTQKDKKHNAREEARRAG